MLVNVFYYSDITFNHYLEMVQSCIQTTTVLVPTLVRLLSNSEGFLNSHLLLTACHSQLYMVTITRLLVFWVIYLSLFSDTFLTDWIVVHVGFPLHIVLHVITMAKTPMLSQQTIIVIIFIIYIVPRNFCF